MTNSKKIKLAATIIIGLIALYMKNKNKDTEVNLPSSSNNTEIRNTTNSSFNFLPSSTTKQIVVHDGYSLSYNEQHEQAEWVAYSLSKNDIQQVKSKP